MHRSIGILGGMGPQATADLFGKIVRATPARRDQDHIRVIIDSDPKIPDRAAYIWGRGPDPRPYMLRAAANLVDAGADLIALPCNTAHAFYDDLAAAVPVPVLHIMREVAAWLAVEQPDIRRIGLLATVTTAKLGLYHAALAEIGVEVLVPHEVAQRGVTRAIYGPDGIKAGYSEPARRRLLDAARDLERRGAQAIVLGCTELPLVLGPADCDLPVIDATEILARAAVREALRDDRRAQV
ncbi:MAG TPA: amino acid racemase [Bacillota bacterium]